jgi:hypothetical protein
MPLPINDFEQLSDDDIPSNSDVVVVLSQYLQCFEKYVQIISPTMVLCGTGWWTVSAPNTGPHRRVESNRSFVVAIYGRR